MIVVFGTICLDRLRFVSHLPAAGEYVEVDRELLVLGGEAANTACALQDWGIPFELIGNVAANLDNRERLASDLLTANAPICDIYITPSGERTMFGFGFRNLGIGVEVPERWPAEGWFSADMNLGETARAAACAARNAGLNTYLMDFLEPDDHFEPGDWWQSSTDWVGERGNRAVNLAEVQRRAETGVHAVLTDAERGVYYASPLGQTLEVQPPRAPSQVDATGAGDRFRAAMLYALYHRWEVEPALKFASAAGALKVGKVSGNPEADSVSEILRISGLSS